MYFGYKVSTGRFSLFDASGREVAYAVGYSGRGSYINDSSGESFVGLGPIPIGQWRIGAPVNHPRLGPQAIPLHRAAIPYGRSGFYIHGDNSRGDFSASNGCIVLRRDVRDAVAAIRRWTGVSDLIVV